jgi:hypothetical protein
MLAAVSQRANAVRSRPYDPQLLVQEIKASLAKGEG